MYLQRASKLATDKMQSQINQEKQVILHKTIIEHGKCVCARIRCCASRQPTQIPSKESNFSNGVNYQHKLLLI